MGRSRRVLTLPEPPRSLVIFCVRGVTSPLLANVYLHYVFDLWVQAWRQKRAHGDVIVVRFADDIVVGFQSKYVMKRSEEHTSELQSQSNLVCRLLLEKKKKT